MKHELESFPPFLENFDLEYQSSGSNWDLAASGPEIKLEDVHSRPLSRLNSLEPDCHCPEASPTTQISLSPSQTTEYQCEERGRKPERSSYSNNEFPACGQRSITWSASCKGPRPVYRTTSTQNTSIRGTSSNPSGSRLSFPSLRPGRDEKEWEIDDRYFASFDGNHPRNSKLLNPRSSSQQSSSRFRYASQDSPALSEIHIPLISAPPYYPLRPYNSCHASRSTSPSRPHHHLRRHLSDTFPLGLKPFRRKHRTSRSPRVIASAIRGFFHDHTRRSRRDISSGNTVFPSLADIRSNFRFDSVPRRKGSSRHTSKKRERLNSFEQNRTRQLESLIEVSSDPPFETHIDFPAEPATRRFAEAPDIPHSRRSYSRSVSPSTGRRRFTNSSGVSSQGIPRDERCLFPGPTRSILPDTQLLLTRTPDNHGTMSLHRNSGLPGPSSAMEAITRHKAEAMKLAKEQGNAVKEMCRRTKTDVPPYEFEELIGKGSYGRVYKGRQIPARKLVAIKVMDVDTLDYKSLRDFRDESIKDFIHESKVMTQVRDAGAKNVNALIEAISLNTQLWLVCEYCPGGSVRTLVSLCCMGCLAPSF